MFIMFQFLHTADLHLDGDFLGPLDRTHAIERQREYWETLSRLANYVNTYQIDLVLLAGDILDNQRVFQNTGKRLLAVLNQMNAQICIAPGNRDWFGPDTPWQSLNWPEHVHIFQTNTMTALEFPAWNLIIHGAAFTGPEQPDGFLNGFTAPRDGKLHFGLMHGEFDIPETRYNPISRENIAACGLHYLALGHNHRRTEPYRLGHTIFSWPGCLESRSFDEPSETGFYHGTVDETGQISFVFLPFARRRYEILEIDMTGKEDPQAAIQAALLFNNHHIKNTQEHLYRILLTGEVDKLINIQALQAAFSNQFYALEIFDQTVLSQIIWRQAKEDSLRGFFLRELQARYARAETEEVRRQIDHAARLGLSVLK